MEYPNNNFNNDPRNIQPQQPQPQAQPVRGAVSKGEMFVATNLLSKIGVVFLIASVIAFSAVSEGYLDAWVRMALVISVGAVMLIVGSLFFKKGSVIFANALIYGGVAELFICSLIGYHGFEVWNEYGSLIMGAIAAAIGFVMMRFTKSQGLLIVTEAFALLPIFTDTTELSVGIAATYFIVINAAVAIISRKKYYNAAVIVGLCMAIIETICVAAMTADAFGDPTDGALHSAIFTISFVICCAVIYSSAPLFNALDEDGQLSAGETALVCVINVTSIITVFSGLYFNVNGDAANIAAGVGLGILAVIYALIATGYALKFWSRCSVTTVFINLVLATVVFGVTFLIEDDVARYITLHVIAAIVLVLGALRDRNLFRIWGYVLLGIAEVLFLALLLTDDSVVAILTNLALWFGLLIFFIARKKTESTLFKIYTCLAFLNAGFLGSYLISEHLADYLEDMELWSRSGTRAAFSALVCATLWMLLGFVVGKLKYLKVLSSVSSFTFYGIGLCCLGWGNLVNFFSGWGSASKALGPVMIIVTVVVNVVSVLSVLDITLQIEGMAPKFAKAIGLVVSAYALMSLTTILGTNDFVKFTSCIISIIYIATAVVWIVLGFWKLNALLRRFGLALVLLASTKLFLFDFMGIDAMGRTLLFIGFGITLLVISFSYGIGEKRLKDRINKS